MRERRDAGDLDRELKRQGIPIVGVILWNPPREPRAEVQYADEATQAERKRGDAIAAAYDWDGQPDD
jgi:hypothetical protein